MRILASLAGVLAVAIAWDINPSITYNQALSCGACVRSGNIFCKSTGDLRQNYTQKCCDTEHCALIAIGNNMTCATTNKDFVNASASYFADPFTMLGQFCITKTGTDPGCGCYEPDQIMQYNACRFNITENKTDVSINQTAMTYGRSCSYELKTGCGYPSLRFDGDNLDIMIAYNKTLWQGDWPQPYERFTQTWNEVEDINSRTTYTMPQVLKTDNVTSNGTICSPSSLYVVVTNLNQDPAVTSRFLQSSTNVTTTMSMQALPKGSNAIILSASALLLSLIAIFA